MFPFACSAALPLLFLLPTAAAVAQQPAPATSTPASATQQQNNAAVLPALDESLHAALVQAGSALNQVQIDHWKLSRQWKQQIHADVNSIQQDLSTLLPGLFLVAQQSPNTLGPQLRLMRNVDALYDVLVRVSTAANLSAGKADAALLGGALQNLEQARKNTTAQMVQIAVQQDQNLADLRARAQNTSENPTSGQLPKKIVVDNRVTHRKARHPAQHRKSPKTGASTTPSTNPQAPPSSGP